MPLNSSELAVGLISTSCRFAASGTMPWASTLVIGPMANASPSSATASIDGGALRRDVAVVMDAQLVARARPGR